MKINSNWFTERNLRVLDYQQNTITKVFDSIKERDITVLAASPSAGKTLMTIFVIEEYIKANPNAKVLVLAHGTTILRSQFHDVLVEYKPNFTFDCATSCDEYQLYSKTKQVVVTLPQTISRCGNLNEIDLLVVDEAHEFYFAKTVKNLIKKSKCKKQLLLTGTPSEFILNNFNIIPVALNTVYDAGMISDFHVEIASSNYNFEFKDFDSEGDLITPNKSFHNTDTKRSLDELIKSIVIYLKSIRNNNYTNLMPEWLPTLKSLKKTMIVCKSQYQAKQVLNYFNNIGVNAALSVSDTDKDSLEILRFKHDKDILVLIVVGRGILGFNYPELVNIVDMTMSYNIDRIYQLVCRVARKHPQGDTKLFFKIAPQMLTDYYQHIMTAVCMLTEEEFFLKYNGKNFKEMEVIIKKAYDNKRNSNKNTDKTSKKQKKYMPVDMDGLPVFEFFKSIYHKKGELLEVYAKTSINDIRSEFMNKMPMGYWTLEKCKEDALNYKTRTEWEKNTRSAYNAAKKNGWFDECTAHMIEYRKPDYTLETCKEDALKYKTRNEWSVNSKSAYGAACNNNWLDICTSHMKYINRPNGYWNNKERCIESAKQYNTRTEWIDKNSAAYRNALKNGWLDECTAHMTSVQKPRGYWTLERCKEDALKYKIRFEWQKNNVSAYQTAHRNGWLEECTTHMVK